MYDNNKACIRCVEEKGQGQYSNCVYNNKDCHDFVSKKEKTNLRFELPLYYFTEIDGKEVCRNMCFIQKRTLEDGRVILVGILSEKVDLKKDLILNELFDSMR